MLLFCYIAIFFSDDLEEEEFEIIGFLHAPEDGVVSALLSHFNLPQLDAGVLGGAVEHLDEKLLRGEVRTGAGGKISAARQQLHGAIVDLLIAGHGFGNGLAALGKGRRIENDEVIAAGLLFQLRQQLEHVGAYAFHYIIQAVAAGVFAGAFHGEIADVHRCHMLGTALGGIEGEGTGVSKAIQHCFALRQLADGKTVIFLVEEKASLLSVNEIYRIDDAVFGDIHSGDIGGGFAVGDIPALALGYALLFPDGHIVTLEDTHNILPILTQDAEKLIENHILALLDTK